MRYAGMILAVFILSLMVNAPLAISERPPRHLDLAQAKEEMPDAMSLLQYYTLVLGLMQSENFLNALNRLNGTRWFHIPERVRFIASRFNDLVRISCEQLDQVRSGIANASQMVGQARLTEAKTVLDAALFRLAQANRTIGELEVASMEVSRSFGIQSMDLFDKVVALRRLASDYRDRIFGFYGTIARIEEGVETKELQSTNLSIEARPLAMEVGSDLHVQGTLRASIDGPLGGKEVGVYFGSIKLASVVTEGDGSFELTMGTPILYVPKVTLFASYLPFELDANVYAPTVSNKIDIELAYESARIAAEVPSAVYPNIPFTITGILSTKTKVLMGHTIAIAAFGGSVSAITGQDGRFQFTLTPPGDIASGFATISLRSEARGNVSQAQTSVYVKVVRVEAELVLILPSLVLAGLPMQVEGLLKANGTALKGVQVELLFSDMELATFSDNIGCFNFTVVPPTTLPSGTLGLIIRANPREAWVKPLFNTRELNLFNPITLLFPSAAAMTLVVSVRKSGRKKRPIQPTAEAKVMEWTGLEAQQISLRVERHPTVELYYWAVELVQRFTGMMLQPNHTIREYLRLVQPILQESGDFDTLSLAAEMALYWATTPDVELIAQKAFAKLRSRLS